MRPALAVHAAALALAGVALPGCLPRGTVGRPVVVALRIEGARAVPETEITPRLQTQPSARYLFTSEPQPYDEDVVAVDRRRIEAFYRSRGYFSARVAAPEVEPRGEGRVEVRFRVEEEGPPVRVAAVQVEGLEGEPQARARLPRLPLAPGDVFTEAGFDAGRKALEEALAASGYPRAEVEQEARVDPADHSARIFYRVTPGGRWKFGNVFVSGTAVVPRARVRQAAAEVMTPGQPWDQTLLPKVQKEVSDLGVFGGIRVQPGQPDPAAGTIPVVVSVREAPFRTVRAGPRLGVQATRYDAGATASWVHRNWLGGLRKLQLDASAGWAWIRSSSTDGPVALLSAELTQPQGIARRVDLGLRLEAEHRIEEGYRYFAERARVSAPVHLGPAKAVPSVNLEYYQAFGGATRGELGGASQALLSCPGDQRTCLLAYLEQSLELDLRDDAIDTHRGLYLALSLQEGIHAFGQGFSYLRALPEVRAFLPIRKSVLAFRGRVGVLHAYGREGVPLLSRFVGGGPGQMRGYASRRLSPLVPLSLGGYAPVGGAGLLDGSLELRVPLVGALGGVLFFDGGNTELQARDIWKLDRLQWAAGLGLRYHSLFGAVRADVGVRLPRRFGGNWPLPKVPLVRLEGTSIVETGDFKAEPAVAIHLSIGEAF